MVLQPLDLTASSSPCQGLLNILKSLDLSHNKIQDCSEFLLPLAELEHLNLGYNFLQRAPLLGLSARNKLLTLVLRNNELETINGVEQLCNLQHLDLSYNLLVEHSQLAPLSLLHCLRTLHLEGNPLFFQRSHRISTVGHLSPRAAHVRLQLDGRPLTSSELVHLPKAVQLIGQVGRTTPPIAMVPERGTQEVSSGAGEMSDSLSVSEPGVSRQRRKKSRNRVRVRRASISEPSDTDYEPRSSSALQDIVLHHQKDIERMDEFRDQLGEDWLRYQHHLEGVPFAAPDTKMPLGPVDSSSDPSQQGMRPQEECPPALMLSSEPTEAAEELETESTLQWPGRSLDNMESALETSLSLPRGLELIPACEEEEEEEEAEFGVDVCLPLLVGLLPEDSDGHLRSTGPLFLRIKSGHALEVDVHTGSVLTRLELDSLREVSISEAMWTDKGEERRLPVLELHFSYISRPRRRRRYVMLDDDPQGALQALASVLSQIAEGNGQQAAAEKDQPGSAPLQCLRCRQVFQQGWSQEAEPDPTAADGTLLCPQCGSDHVVQLAAQTAPATSTPVLGHSEANATAGKFFGKAPPAGDHQVLSALLGNEVPQAVEKEQQNPNLEEADLTDTFLTARSGTFYIGSASYESDGLPGFQSSAHADSTAPLPAEGKDDLDTSWKYCYSAPQLQFCPSPPPEGSSISIAQFDLSSEDFDVVDHRLKLFLDVEVFEDDSEELRCFFKAGTSGPEGKDFVMVLGLRCVVLLLELTSQGSGGSRRLSKVPRGFLSYPDPTHPISTDQRSGAPWLVTSAETQRSALILCPQVSVVKLGDPEEFPTLLVVSDQHFYFLEIGTDTQGQPCDWLQKRERYGVAQLRYLEVGLGSQSIHMEFEEEGASFTLLVRDSSRCKRFFSFLAGKCTHRKGQAPSAASHACTIPPPLMSEVPGFEEKHSLVRKGFGACQSSGRNQLTLLLHKMLQMSSPAPRRQQGVGSSTRNLGGSVEHAGSHLPRGPRMEETFVFVHHADRIACRVRSWCYRCEDGTQKMDSIPYKHTSGQKTMAEKSGAWPLGGLAGSQFRSATVVKGIARELAPTSESKLQSISTTRLGPQHHLWYTLFMKGVEERKHREPVPISKLPISELPVVFRTLQPLVSDAVNPDVQLQFFYLLAFIKQDDGLSPVTVLATEECLYLLNEDHQWCKNPAGASGTTMSPGDKVTVRENQPISCVSSVRRFSSNPHRVDITLYDEANRTAVGTGELMVLKEEKVWALKTDSEDLTQALVDWVRTHWEAMFGVKLTTSVQESVS
ncbi:serine/threonine-protein kinase 11-interacting protein-like [Scleropages formosus]|uniref:Serine/threonine-protein kinase 11-interacting protein-like n=1 Tax=Scleropages formosus TaxID=113540 RepID=A0A0P7UG15_SCLFO|nr:serine/threonine-protein kinase 11-interacting protein-like [Scleropages formosus]